MTIEILHAEQAIVNGGHDSNGGMRLFAAITCVVLAGCSASEIVETANALDVENMVKACMTDEILREAHASEEEIRQFKKDQAEAGAVSCG